MINVNFLVAIDSFLATNNKSGNFKDCTQTRNILNKTEME